MAHSRPPFDVEEALGGALAGAEGLGRARRCRSVSSLALSASVRATSTVGTPHHVGREARRVSVRMNCDVGTSTLPPRWPHFFSLASWSSKCTPAAPASIMPFISS
jgi:hypothetical protein